MTQNSHDESRYQVVRPQRSWTVVDGVTRDVVMRSPDESQARRYAAARNSCPVPTPAAAAPTSVQVQETPPPAAAPTGWSNASRRRASTGRSHPFGRAMEAGDGYTVYEDTAFGGGRVQIWDQS